VLSKSLKVPIECMDSVFPCPLVDYLPAPLLVLLAHPLVAPVPALPGARPTAGPAHDSDSDSDDYEQSQRHCGLDLRHSG
jgi:hypothetical protein